MNIILGGMITIIADDKIPFLKGALEPFASVKYMDGREINNSTVRDAGALLIRTRTVCNESLLHDSHVKFIGTTTIGFDHIDTDYCDAHSIRWSNAPGCNASSVQQYIASVLANLVVRHDYSLYGKTLGIIGVGHVGKKVEILARMLGMKVLLNDPPRARTEGNGRFIPLEQLLKESDIISLHVPLNRRGDDKTFHLINETTLGLFKTASWLINTSRGEVVDSNALKSMLLAGKLSGSALDVWEREPSVDLQLLEKVTIATPHIAGYSTDGKRNGTIQIVRSLGAYFDLPVKDWEPTSVPGPNDPVLVLDCRDGSTEKLICNAILHTYDVTEDDSRFRSHPGDFEIQRDNYPVRREFLAYKLILKNGTDHVIRTIKNLGFRVIAS
jgi:erythronate-4-phosphate dehydrogenase